MRRPSPVSLSAALAKLFSTSRSERTCAATSGLCTLIAIGVPSRSAALCTCASEAVPSGMSSNAEKAVLTATPSSDSTISRIHRERFGSGNSGDCGSQSGQGRVVDGEPPVVRGAQRTARMGGLV